MKVHNSIQIDVHSPSPSQDHRVSPGIASVQPNEEPDLFDANELTVPISTRADPVDTALYRDPKNTDKQFYLPRYQLAKEEVGDETRYRISMDEDGEQWSLTLFLEPYVAEELVATVGDAQALPHTLSVTMEHQVDGRKISKSFDEIVERESDIQLTMKLEDMRQRDVIYAALTQPEHSNSLNISRNITVAVPVEVKKSVPKPVTSSVVLKKLGNKIATIKSVKKWLGLGLSQSKALVEKRPPVTLAKSMERNRATAFMKELKRAGCTVVLETSTQQPQRPIRERKADVWLKAVGQTPVSVIKVLEKFAGIPPTKAKLILRSPAPIKVVANSPMQNAMMLVSRLKSAGATPSLTKARSTARPRAATTLVRPRLSLVGAKAVEIRSKKFTRYSLSVTNVDEFSPLLFKPAPDLPPCGNNTKASRTWVEISDQRGKRIYGYCALSKPSSLAKLSFHIREGSTPPESVRISLNDRRTRTVRHSNLVGLDNESTTTVTKYKVIQVESMTAAMPDPLVFDERLHSYIFTFLDQQGRTDLIRHELLYNGRSHSYFVDAQHRHRVFYLPDSFKIARWDRPPYAPKMSVTIQSREDSSGISDVLVTFLAAPVVDKKRLAQAAATLQTSLSDANQSIEMLHYPVNQFSFRVSHPSAAGNVVVDQDTSTSDFYQGVHSTLSMELADFLPCFAAMMGKTAASFHGSGAVSISGTEQIINIPFTADFADLAGALFEHAVLEGREGSVSLSLINSIESSLSINSLEVTLKRGAMETSAAFIAEPNLPCVLAAGDTLSMEILPEQSLAESGPLMANVDTNDVEVVLDEAAIFGSILDRTSTDFFGLVTVRVAPNIFNSIVGQESRQIVGIIVHFEGGGVVESVNLAADQTSATAKVSYAVEDLFLRNETSLTYRYWYQVARANGETETFESQEQGIDDFFLNVAHLWAPQNQGGV